MYHVYILYNAVHDKFYIGHTNDISRRIAKHNQNESNYTSKYPGKWELVYSEHFQSRREAMSREKFLKKQKSKAFYRALISQQPTG